MLFMNIFVPFAIFLVLAPTIYFMNLESNSFENLFHNNDSTIFVGEGESCRGLGVEVQCLEGFECVLLSTYPEINGVCMKQGTILKNDSINKLDFNNIN